MPANLNISDIINDAVDRAIAGVKARLEREFAATAVQPRKAPPTRAAGARRGRRRERRNVEMTKWVADRNARRVPTFVIEMTGGLDTKKKIVAKYGENASFEKGKPLPKPAK